MFYPFNILCIQCTFFYTSVWSLRLMLVSDIVVLILDRDLSGFYVYFAPLSTSFLAWASTILFSVKENEKASKEECVQFLYYIVGSYLGTFSHLCIVDCVLYIGLSGTAVKTNPLLQRLWYIFGLNCCSNDTPITRARSVQSEFLATLMASTSSKALLHNLAYFLSNF